MNEFFESITNLRQLDYEQQIQKIVDTQLQTVLDELATHALDQDLTGMCKILASNIQADLQQVGIQARLMDFNKLSGVDHWSLIVERPAESYIIDPSYKQFCQQDSRQMKGNKTFFDQKLTNPLIAANLHTQGYHKATQDDLADYLNSFKS